MNAAAALDAALCTYWVTAAALCSAAHSAPQNSGLRALLMSCAARGKLVSPPSSPAAPQWLWRALNLHVPHSWFAHFYVLGCFCNGAALLRHLACATQQGFDAATSAESLAAQLLFQLHVLRRLAESMRAARQNSGALMHLGGYLFGLTFYIAASFSWISATNAIQLFSPDAICSFERVLDSVPSAAFAKPTTLLGAAIFVFGTVHQAKCHRILAELKASCRPTRVGNCQRYGIPRGSWFEYCSCAHYLAEIVIYVGLAVICASRSNVILLLIAVIANLQFAATLTHAWYLENVPDYPRSRAALWPSWP